MTDTVDMELLERGSALACLAEWAAEAHPGAPPRHHPRPDPRRAAFGRDAGQRALELWRTADDRLREGDSTRRLSGMMRSLCRGQDAEAAAQTAVAILESLAPGVELAQAYANQAAQEMLTGRYEAATETARRAQSLADLAGAPQVMSDALNSEAVAAAIVGREWTGLLERALQIALAEASKPRSDGRTATSTRCTATSGDTPNRTGTTPRAPPTGSA